MKVSNNKIWIYIKWGPPPPSYGSPPIPRPVKKKQKHCIDHCCHRARLTIHHSNHIDCNSRRMPPPHQPFDSAVPDYLPPINPILGHPKATGECCRALAYAVCSQLAWSGGSEEGTEIYLFEMVRSSFVRATKQHPILPCPNCLQHNSKIQHSTHKWIHRGNPSRIGCSWTIPF